MANQNQSHTDKIENRPSEGKDDLYHYSSLLLVFMMYSFIITSFISHVTAELYSVRSIGLYIL